MKNFKRKYEFETNVPVPGIEEIMKVATDFSEPQEDIDESKVKNGKYARKDTSLKLDKGLSSMRSKMMMLAEAVAEDEVGARLKNTTEEDQEKQEDPENKDTNKTAEDNEKGE